MKKLAISMALVMGFVAVSLAWDQVNTSVDGLNVKGGTLAIDAVKITATAAELNKTDGLTATPAQLNAAVGAIHNVTATQSKAAVTATAVIQGQTYTVVDVAGATNSMVSPTNIVVTVVNGGAVVTNISLTVTP
jgi:flagellar hook-basal body complex protein FliE